MITQRSLNDFFQTEVANVATELKCLVPPETQIYLANLLTRFADSRSLFVEMEGKRELEPLAFILRRALEAEDEGQRTRILLHLGDFALYTSGVFSDRIERRGVEVDYYIAMGGRAYSDVSNRARRRPFRELYATLAMHFQSLVQLLQEICDRWQASTPAGLMALYKKWQGRQSDRVARLLVREGFILVPGSEPC